MKTAGITIRGIAASIPDNQEDNLELDILDEATRKKLVKSTGIRYRWIASHLSAASLCLDASSRLLGELKWKPSDVQLLVVVTQTPDKPIPGPASSLQYQLGLNDKCLVLDINQGCAGFVYGLSVASSLMQSFGFKRGLLLAGDTITKHISADNASLRPIFSDAGTAIALEQNEGSEIHFAFGVNGGQADTICLDAKTGVNSDLQMNGHNVFTFGLTDVAKGLALMLEEDESSEKIDYLVMHQANKLLNDAIMRKLGFSEEKTPSSHYEYGNTSSATIPLTIATQLGTEAFSEKKNVMLAGFGVGLTWGGAILDMQNVLCLPINKI